LIAAMKMANEDLVGSAAHDESVLRRLSLPGMYLHNAARDFAAYLKGSGLSAEKAIVALKQTVVAFERLPRHVETKSLSDCVISLCIEEYYRP
jgi:hypothetical protein